MTPADSPSRLMVLMFTDLVGSVDLKMRVGLSAYAPLIARHDEIFHQALADVGGVSAKVLQDTGDGFYASFPTVSAAVRRALRFQSDIAREPWTAKRGSS